MLELVNKKVIMALNAFLEMKQQHCHQLKIEGHFGFRAFWKKLCNILKSGMNLKFETIVQFLGR